MDRRFRSFQTLLISRYIFAEGILALLSLQHLCQFRPVSFKRLLLDLKTWHLTFSITVRELEWKNNAAIECKKKTFLVPEGYGDGNQNHNRLLHKWYTSKAKSLKKFSTKTLFCESSSIFMYKREMLFSVLRCLFPEVLASFWNQPTACLEFWLQY